MTKEHPEEPGYYNLPGFVKGNPLNNESYLEKCCKTHPEWAELLKETDKKLEQLIPGYNISQIKEKFFGLRFYIDFPEGTTQEVREQAWKILLNAENSAQRIEPK